MRLAVAAPKCVPQTPTSLPVEPTTIASWALLVAQAIERAGGDASALFAEAGMSLASARADPNVRFPVAAMTRLWALAIERCGDPCLPMRLAQAFRPENVGAVGVAMSLSASLLEALQRCVRYSRVATEGARLSLHENADALPPTVSLRIDVPPAYRRLASGYSIEAFVCIVVELLRRMDDADFSPRQICFAHEHTGAAETYADFFGCPVRFGSGETCIDFDRERLLKSRQLALGDVASALDGWMATYVARLDTSSVVDQVRAFLVERMAEQSITLADVARHLKMSERSLQRRLADDGGSFASLRDATRRQLAEHLVAEQRLSLGEIAFTLGFTDQSAFTRSFRRWTGMSPGRYARQRR